MPSLDFSFWWIGDRSELDRHAIHPKLKSNDVDKSEDSNLYLSATEGKTFANENLNGSFLANQHADKKNTQKRPLQAFVGRTNKVE